MIHLNFDGLHSGDVIMVMPVITSLKCSGNDVKVFVGKYYKHFLAGFNLDYLTIPSGIYMGTHSINGHITDHWIDYFAVSPVKFVINSNESIRTVVLSPDSRIRERRMDESFWNTIIDWCVDRNIPVTVIGPHDAVQYNSFTNREGVSNLTGNQSIDELHSTLKNALAVVTTDTGTSHLSDALNDVTITAFKLNNHEKYAPFWSRNVVFNSDEAIQQLDKYLN